MASSKKDSYMVCMAMSNMKKEKVKYILSPKDKKVIRAQKRRTNELEAEYGKYVLAPEDNVRVVLFGKTGTGKSHCADNLVNQDVFVYEAGSESVTKRCQFAERLLDKKIKLYVVDTPGLFDTRDPTELIIKEIVRSIALLEPGPHIFIIVIPIGRFTQEQVDTVTILQETFGEQVIQHVIIVFTRKDDLGSSKSPKEFIKNSPPVLQNLLERCGYRFAFINNKAGKDELQEDVNIILDLIYKTIGENKGTYYTNDMYQKASELLEARTKEIQREKECMQTELRQKLHQIIKTAKGKFDGTDEQRFLKVTEELEKTNDENERQICAIEERKQLLTQKMKNEDKQHITREDERKKDEQELLQLEDKLPRLQEDDRIRKLEKDLQRLQQNIVSNDSDYSKSKTVLELAETNRQMTDNNQRNPCEETKKEVEEGDDMIKTVASTLLDTAMNPGSAAVSFVSGALSTGLQKFRTWWG